MHLTNRVVHLYLFEQLYWKNVIGRDNLKKTMIILVSIVLLIIVGLGFRGGFYPLEHNIIIRNATRYVIETHGLTPTEVQITTLYLWFPVTVRIETEENDFWFTLRTGRFFYGRRNFIDNYIEQLSMDILTRDLRAYVESVTNIQSIVEASTGGFLLSELRKDDVNIIDDPNNAFEILRRQYRLSIMLFDDIYDINYDLIYNIYSHVFELGLEPYSINFSFGGRDEMGFWESHLSVTISYRHGRHFPLFSEINSVDDFRRVFEEEKRRR